MPSLETSIDVLYQGPLDEFVAGRKALAKTLTGDEAQRVKQLQKPTSVAWAVNQLYWHRRPVFDRLAKSGKKLRAAQVSALGGHRVDIRQAAEDHRAAIAEAVAETSTVAAESGIHPNAEELARTLEALSLDVAAADAGRLVRSLQPAGFEALAGLVVKPAAPSRTTATSPAEESAGARSADGGRRRGAPHKDAERRREREEREARTKAEEKEQERRKAEEEKEAQKKKAEAVESARALVAQAKEAEAQARLEWERRRKDREAAEKALAELE
jgi:hypothetical protein